MKITSMRIESMLISQICRSFKKVDKFLLMFRRLVKLFEYLSRLFKFLYA